MRLPSILQVTSLPVIAASLLAITSPAQAGGSFGPAPFQNGSLLVSGTDGIYQGVATGRNATGIIGFAINNGVQTATARDNGWTFFVDGQVLSGTTSANVSQGKVMGILDSAVAEGVPTNEDGTVQLPVAFLVSGNAGSGSFSADIDPNDPIAAFRGNGIISGTPARTDQIVLITGGENSPTGIIIVPLTIPGSSLADLPFKLRGSRLTTTSTTTTANQTLAQQ